MVFKKTFQSKDMPVILENTNAVQKLFPPGFRYKIGSIIYTIKGDVTQEIVSPMREISLSDGGTEIISVESIMKDLKEPDCELMDPDPRFAIKEEKTKKKVTKKTTKKKKSKRKS